MEWHGSLSNLFVILLLFVISLYILTSIKTPKNLPPGPKGLPYLGYFPFLGRSPHVTLKKLSEKYGDIMTLYLGPQRAVVLSSFKAIKEFFHKQGHIYIERPENFKKHMIFSKERGLTASTAEPFIVLRRFTLSTFRNIGMGKTTMEPRIMEEMSYVIEEINKFKGQPAYFDDLFAKSVGNMIFTIIFGKRMEYNENKFQELIYLSKEFILALGIQQWAQFLPRFMNSLFGIKEPRIYSAQLYDKLLAEIANDRSTSDSFLNAWKSEARQSDANSQFFTDERLAHMFIEFFVAGNDTTSKTLELGLLHLIKYPKIQERVQHEIDNVIGKDRAPTMSDRKLMPFTEATIMEINRVSAIVPLALPHWAIEDNIVDGYFIPKDTIVIANSWAILNNPEIFPEPECFKPERFLTEDNRLINIEEFIPFSIGKRQCVGESLAKMELFLYFTSLLQHFTFSKDCEVILKTQYSLVLEPTHQKFRATLR